MPRQARLDIPGLLHHVMARGIEGREIFRLNKEREEFLERLAEMASEKGGPTVYAWALMSNHFHLLIRPAEMHLSTFDDGHALRWSAMAAVGIGIPLYCND